MVRNKDDLKVEAQKLGIVVPDHWRTRDIMDALRERIGTFDPALQIDPAKAQDLKRHIDWTADDPFHKISPMYFNDKWVLEPKLDGVRFRFFLGAKANTLNTGRRSVKNFAYIERADQFPHLRDAVVPLLAGTIIDGELMPPAGVSSIMTGVRKGKEEWTKGPLNTVMSLVGSAPARAIQLQKEYGPAVFMAFDIMALNGESMMHQPLHVRREALDNAVTLLQERTKCVQIVEQLEPSAESILLCVENGFEGAMLKRRESIYVPGKRLADWQKVKTMSAGDFFIIGSNPGTGKNEGKIGSLQVAYWDDDKPVYCADVGGLTDSFRHQLTDPVTGGVRTEWINTVIEVMAQGVTKNRRLRHPHFKRTRPDKTPLDCDPASSIDLFSEV